MELGRLGTLTPHATKLGEGVKRFQWLARRNILIWIVADLKLTWEKKIQL